jgi:hypothetical protein
MGRNAQHIEDPGQSGMRVSNALTGAPKSPRAPGLLGKAALLLTAAAICHLALRLRPPHPLFSHTSWSPAILAVRKRFQESAQCQQPPGLQSQAAVPPVLEELLVMITFRWDVTHLAMLAMVRRRAVSAPPLASCGGLSMSWSSRSPCLTPANDPDPDHGDGAGPGLARVLGAERKSDFCMHVIPESLVVALPVAAWAYKLRPPCRKLPCSETT